MHTTNLRKVGGSVMLAVPRAVLDVLDLREGNAVAMTVEAGRLVIEPRPRRRYALHELLARCDATAPQQAPESARDAASVEDAEWTGGAPRGRELI